MIIQESILAIYASMVKRIRSWLLPVILILLLSSAYGRTNPVVLSYFTSIQLASTHFFLGWLLGLIWLILVYDFFFKLLTGVRDAEEAAWKTSRLTTLIDAVFCLLLILICVSGYLQYAIRFSAWRPFYLHRIDINLAHITLGWLFISSALIKYYLSITRWFHHLLSYLRAD